MHGCLPHVPDQKSERYLTALAFLVAAALVLYAYLPPAGGAGGVAAGALLAVGLILHLADVAALVFHLLAEVWIWLRER
jgi:hypothetical protein